jgi:membrane protein YqaA with SNARE-associated domain
MHGFLARLESLAAGHPLELMLFVGVVCFVSGFLPLIHSETFLVSASALCPPSFILPMAASAAIGQMGAKVLLYFAGVGVMRLPLHRYHAKAAAARERFERRRGRTGTFLFASAVLGFPPFYAVSVMAGALRLDLVTFVLTGLAGRFVRFAVFVALPQLRLLWS